MELTIGTFAGRVGLTPSALRFYDDCGVLRPKRVDAATGYRYYEPAQEPRAILLRRLRQAELPLAEVAVVLDGQAADAREVLRGHLDRVRAAHATTRSVVEALLTEFSAVGSQVVLDGAELASAVRQVAPSASARPGYPVLECVLLEVADAEMRVVATDRYRLAMRVLKPRALAGAATLLVPATEAVEIGEWAARTAELTITIDDCRARALGPDGSTRDILLGRGDFPDYRTILSSLDPVRHRVIAGRTALRDALAAGVDPVVLSAHGDRLTVEADGESSDLPVIIHGEPPRTAFDPAVLGPAIEASVGPDVLLEMTGRPESPVVVRSADQGSFTTFVMPVRL